MRAVLVHRLPALSAVFGIKPWEIEQLTDGELHSYLAALMEIEEGGDGG